MNCNGRRWAVRCFLRNVPDQQQRYAAISGHLRSARLPSTVGFEYLREGIRIKGDWFPILKMEWVDGEELHSFIGKNLQQPAALQGLARQWIELMKSLKASQIAHGDLQHGNVLVAGGALKLIDYDGMYVPALAGKQSNEDGHRNYQHPSRTAKDFNLQLDNFSAWVIFISLSVLSLEPRLWQRLNGGDDALIFRREDFDRPSQSKAFEALENSGRADLKAFSAHLRSLLYLPIGQVPDVSGTVVPTAPSPPPKSTSGGVGAVPSWLADHVTIRPESGLGELPPLDVIDPVPPVSVVAGADWLFDHIVAKPPLTPLVSSIPVHKERAVFWGGLALSVGVGLILAFPGRSLPAAGILFIGIQAVSAFYLFVRFSSLEAVTASRETRERARSANRTAAQLDAAVASANAERSQAMEPLRRLDHRYRQLPRKSAEAIGQVHERLNSQVAALAMRRSKLADKENEEIRSVERRIHGQIEQLVRRRNDLAQAEQMEISGALRPLVERHVAQRMASARLSDANLTGTGIGVKLKARLVAAGIVTAADVEFRTVQIPGIGATKAWALVAWRDEVLREAMASAPQSLPLSEESRIRGLYVSLRAQLNADIEKLQERLREECRAVREAHERYRRQVDQEENDAREASYRQEATVRTEFENEKIAVQREFNGLRPKVLAERDRLDRQIGELSKAAYQHRLKQYELQRELDRFRGLTFARFILRIVGLRRAA